jgi:hypothetical protein
MRNEVRHRVKKDRNILYTIKRMQANWIGHILWRNCLLKHVTDGRTEVRGREGRRCKQLLYEFKEMGGGSGNWQRKHQSAGRGYRQTT